MRFGPRLKSIRRTLMKETLQLFCFLLALRASSGQEEGSRRRLSLENVALYKTVSGTATEMTCGEPQPTSYCAAVGSELGLRDNACERKICNQMCPNRDRNGPKTSFIDMLDTDMGTCVDLDFSDVRKRGSQSYRFYNRPRCGLSPPTVPKIGQRGQFTVSVWLKQSPGNAGVIFEKVAQVNGAVIVILTIQVNARGVVLQYFGMDYRPHFKFISAPIPPNTWCHLGIQVYNRDISVFVDEVEKEEDQRGAEVLVSDKLEVGVSDHSGRVYVVMGHRVREPNDTRDIPQSFLRNHPELVNSTSQYVGRMQEFRWYDVTLTNREMEELVTGSFEEIYLQSNCLCPENATRLHPGQRRFCLPNGVDLSNTSLWTLRLNRDAHPLAYMIDGDPKTTWISSSDMYMPGGLTLAIDLVNGEYEVFYVTIKFYNSLPKTITISRNSTLLTQQGRKPLLWGYYADDCYVRFNLKNNGTIERPDEASCISFPEEVPYSSSNITLSLVSSQPPRPGHDDFYGTPSLMEFVKATQVHIRLTNQYYTLGEDVHPKHTYYGIREIEVVGRCNCHGHAVECNTQSNPYKCKCLGSSNTEGNMCERCKPLYNDKEFRIGNDVFPYRCRKCQCNNHAESCHYERQMDPNPDNFLQGGGGVCDDCQHNTIGRHCEFCKPRFYRKPNITADSIKACSPCRCRRAGVVNQTMVCDQDGGQCLCKSKVTSRRCNTCMDGYYNLQLTNEEGCVDCQCFLGGTINRNSTCNKLNGGCNCKANVRGRTCSECTYEFKNLTDGNPEGCEPCSCNKVGATGQHCNPSNGQCVCREFVQGLLCDECVDGYWSLSATGCRSCDCDPAGTEPGTLCNKVTGQCVCKANTQGRACNECRDEYYSLQPSNSQGCQFCSCDKRGTVNGSLVCDKVSGDCSCKSNVGGRVCNLCRGNTFGLREDLMEGCEPCNCDPMGTASGLELDPHELVCDSNSGQCACLPSREGRRCDQCSPGFYLPPSNETGCLVCDCHPVGSTNQICSNVTGMCPCKPVETGAGLTGRRCDECARTFWSFHDLIGTCRSCDCDVAGSESDDCNVITGQCNCKGNVVGQQCATCRPGSSQLSASNPMGCYSHPEQQAAPLESDVRSRTITLSWDPPDYPNGDFLSYELFRNEEMIFNTTDSNPFASHQFNDTGLLPYTDYNYYIETTNVGGSVLSPTLQVRTLAGIPTGIPPLEVDNIRARQASFRWGKPEVAHGPIETYVLQSVTPRGEDRVEVHYRGLETSAIIHSLHAFTNYTFTLRACTSGGCGNSLPVTVLTHEAEPESQPPPVVVALSNTSFHVTWDPPDEPNGVIIEYELMMRGSSGPEGIHRPLQRLVFQSSGAYNSRSDSFSPLDPPKSNFTQGGLQPFKEYEFLVSSSNKLGSVESFWTTARTQEGTPIFMHPPNLQAISSSAVNISWKIPDPVTEVRGEVVMYQVILSRNNTSGNPFAPPTEEVVIFSSGPKIHSYIARGFDPYSSHNISINLCNSIACIRSNPSYVRTLPAAPEGQAPPDAKRGRSSVQLTWGDPVSVNGPQPDFTLMRSDVAFSQPPVEMSRGVRFPGVSYVRFPPSILPRDASYTGIELKFRTFNGDSILFFSASSLSSEGVREEYVVLQLRGGRPWFLFDAQNNPTAVTTSNDAARRYDDGEWHRVEARRVGRVGFLEVDEVFTGSNTSAGATTVIGQSDGVYFGGIPSNYDVGRPDDENEHVVVQKALIGCLKDIRVQQQTALGDWSNVTWDDADQWYRAYPPWQGCPITLDRHSAHFMGRGFIKLTPDVAAFYLDSWTVKLSFRSTFTSGILFYIGSTGDSVIIATLYEERVRLIFNRGAIPVLDVVALPRNSSSNFRLCDGKWHDVTMIKTRDHAMVEVDKDIWGKVDITSAETQPDFNLEGPIFIGGVPESISKEIPILLGEDVTSFGGCMKRIMFDDENIDFANDVINAMNVNLDGCPINGRPESSLNSNQISESSSEDSSGEEPILFPPSFNHSNKSCRNNSIDVLYSGSLHSYLDTSAQTSSFTLFLYKVSSSNAGGEAESNWMVTRSGEGIPQMVASPFNEQSVSGGQVSLEWKRPSMAQGVITNYTITTLRLYFGDSVSRNVSEDPQNTPQILSFYPGDIYQAVVSGLAPFTTYSFTLTACNLVGCTTSAGGASATTLQEVPQDVQTPSADVNATSMVIHWRAPKFPNGKIVGYKLFHNSTGVYEGLGSRYLISGLPIFTQQHFQLEACTEVGCNRSRRVTLYSGQLPPSHVDQPMVTVMGPHKVEVRWLRPAIMNGVFHRYVMYIQQESAPPPGDVLYNSTDITLEHVIRNLTAGALYYVRITACTGGGCRMSSPTPFQTKESAPEDVPPPDVDSHTPHSFTVSWVEPGLPNGAVTLYNLYQNQGLVFNSTAPSSTQITGLKPWSRHEFRLQVCTKTGCSFGPSVTRRTKQSPPVGNVELSVTVLSPRSVQALWSNPRRKNGRMRYDVICSGIFYENATAGDYAIKRSSRVMLNSSVADEWVTVDGLIPYSEYIVKVNASNDAGYVISNMRTVTMPPGSPDGIRKPIVTSQSPYSILVTWKDPVRNNAKGNSLFQLEYRAVFPPENEREAFDSATRQMSFNLTGLMPFNEYEFQLIASNEYGSTYSGWVSTYTMQARPSSIDPPIVYDIDAWSLYVKWDAPSSPNGVVVGYNLFQNSELRAALPGNVTNYNATLLTPFTPYTFRVEACTVVGCTPSNNSRRVRTSASAPEELQPPNLRSDSPESVFVTWKPPRLSNGILDRYTLERRNSSDNDRSRPTLLGVFVPSQSLRYLDEGGNLVPFTSYQYRVNCSTLGGGSISSSWATVTTRPGRPGGVLAPLVVVTGSESVYVKWKPPLYPNGPLLSYEILFPFPRVAISNVSLVSFNVSGLIPYHDYQISLIACTRGGCTQSPSVHALTFPDVPQGLNPPIATPISERTVNVQWAPPEFPNGPDLRYELSRMILSQPLAPDPSPYINVTQTIYRGTALFYRDRSLQKFTTCQYKVSVFNSQGSFTSNGTVVTSLAGYPLKAVDLHVAVHNHTAVLLWWGIPSVENLQGRPLEYVVRYNSTLYGGGVGSFAPDVTTWRLNNLHPGTAYRFQLTINNGAHNVSSQPVFATTDDGAPHGLRPPVVYPLSPSQLRVSWLPPDHPNGRITEYNIIIDDDKIRTGQREATAYVIDDLRPYTIYNIRLEVCTVYACAVSNVTQATTKEAPPSGLVPPKLKVMRGNEVQIEWKEPARLNGILKSYHLQRRMQILCEELKLQTKKEVCEYVKCPVGEKVCGRKCYSPTEQVCCSGVLHKVVGTKECCGSSYLAVRRRPSDVCCGGHFESYQENFQCCYGKYVKVEAGETCCKDPVEDRVTVGAGDSCCAEIPYYNNGQVCCGGRLHDGFNKICCGGKVISNNQMCCGNSEKGAVYDVIETKACCGLQYLSRNSTLCCYGNNEYKAHVYANMTSLDLKCCSREVIASRDSCCNGVGYDPSAEVCADVATTALGDSSLPPSCGSGTVCPIGRFIYAACDRCDVDREEFECFRSSVLSSYPQSGRECTTPFTTIYSGRPSVMSYLDSELEYYRTYEYKLIAENKLGEGESEIADVTTEQAPPSDVQTPDWSSENRETISLWWKTPGVITEYALMRDGLEIWSGLALRHTDRYDVLPYREYKYVLKVCTSAGCSSSTAVKATSVQGVPQSILPPRLTVTSSTSILIQWLPPGRSNGVIEKYLVNETLTGTIHTVAPPPLSVDDLHYEQGDLAPYSLHSYSVIACTKVGCSGSGEATIRTSEAPPSGVWHRSALLPLNETAVELIWGKPEHENGVVDEYQIVRRVVGDVRNGEVPSDLIESLPWVHIYDGGSEVFSTIDTVGGPGSIVQYKLIATNGAGSGVSSIKEVHLPNSSPTETPVVHTQVLSPTSMMVNWSFNPDKNPLNVEEFLFKVILEEVANTSPSVSSSRRRKRSIEGDDSSLVRYIATGSNLSLVIDDLKPFTRYNVRVQTCDRNSTGSCSIGMRDDVRTSPASPVGLDDPVVKTTSSTSISVTWKPPSGANGVITGYRVYRRISPSDQQPDPYKDPVYFSSDSSAFSYTDSGLLPFTEYQYQLQVSNREGTTSSGWVSVTTQQGIPTGLVRPTLEAVSAFAVKATWSPPSTPNGIITSYRLEYKMIDADPTLSSRPVTALTTSPSDHEAVFSGLDPYTHYRVRVVAVNQVSNEGYSPWGDVTTLSAPPSELEDLEAVAVTGGASLLLTWGEPALPNGKIEFYRLYEAGYEGPALYVGSFRQFQVRRLKPYTDYTFMLEACSGPDLCTKSSPATFRTAETTPEAQTPPQVAFNNATAIVITWSRPLRANGRVVSYEVLRRIIPRKSQISSSRGERSLTKDLVGSESKHKLVRYRRQVDDDSSDDDVKVVFEVLNPRNQTYSYTDTDLKPYMQYAYQVRTSTRAGSIESDWEYTETHQGPPKGLKPPIVTRSPDKVPTSLTVTWQLPQELNGELQTFQLERNDSVPFSFSPDQFRFVDSGLQPFTLYSYQITACTGGGCTTSAPTTMRTFEEAPLYVAPPSVDPLNSSAAEARWTIPRTTNGVIVTYRLYFDQNISFEGENTNAIVGGLTPYTPYEVSVEACTGSGCRRSESVKVRTLEAPPTGLHAPELHATSSSSVEVIWRLPDHPNGDIVRYELHRDGELIYSNNGEQTRYHDFGLSAGTRYSYVVTATNKEGSTRSAPPAVVRTAPSAPSGMGPPLLQVTSPSSISAEWEPPTKPNGIIRNYTLFVRHQSAHDDESVYEFAGSVLSFHVRGLDFFQEYLFWVRVCTDRGCVMSERVTQRTMEAKPANQMAPRVTLGYRNEILVSWDPPSKPNGVISSYLLKRRRIAFMGSSLENLEAEKISNQTGTTFTDLGVSPYTQYQYQVTSANNAGEAPSSWSLPIRSKEAAPSGVPAPLFERIRSRSVHVDCGAPQSPNGVVKYYHLYVRESNSTNPFEKIRTSSIQELTVSNLLPSTSYLVQTEMCTLETLCAKGPSSFFTTLPAPPSGQTPPQLRSISAFNASLSWSAPKQPNGIVKSYDLHVRQACPPSQQPFPQECVTGPTILAYSGNRLRCLVENLEPYTAYAFSVTSYNDHGKSQSEWRVDVTLKSQPVYARELRARRNISFISVVWLNSFELNSQLQRYELTDRDNVVYTGIRTQHLLRRTSAQVHEFQATVYTDSGVALSPVFIYDTTSSGESVLRIKNDFDSNDDVIVSSTELPFYQTVWFILLVALVVMVIIGMILALVIKKMARTSSKHSNNDMLDGCDPSNVTPHGRNQMMALSTIHSPSRDGSLYNLAGENFQTEGEDATSEEDGNGGLYNRSYSFESLNRSTNQLIGKDLYLDRSMEEFDGSWQESNPTLCDAIMSVESIQNDFDEKLMDRKKKDDVSRKRNNWRRKQQNNSREATYYRDADDIAYYDVTSGVSFVQWSEKFRKTPIQYRLDARNVATNNSNEKWGKPPMPVTFYKKNRGPFTVI